MTLGLVLPSLPCVGLPFLYGHESLILTALTAREAISLAVTVDTYLRVQIRQAIKRL